MLRAADNDIRLDSHPLQLLYACLRGLCLHLLGSLKIGDERHMNENTVLMPNLMLELSDGLKKWLALDIADSAAHLDDGNLRVGGGEVSVEAALYFVCDMGDNLNRAPAVIPASLLVENGPVNLSRCYV